MLNQSSPSHLELLSFAFGPWTLSIKYGWTFFPFTKEEQPSPTLLPALYHQSLFPSSAHCLISLKNSLSLGWHISSAAVLLNVKPFPMYINISHLLFVPSFTSVHLCNKHFLTWFPWHWNKNPPSHLLPSLWLRFGVSPSSKIYYFHPANIFRAYYVRNTKLDVGATSVNTIHMICSPALRHILQVSAKKYINEEIVCYLTSASQLVCAEDVVIHILQMLLFILKDQGGYIALTFYSKHFIFFFCSASLTSCPRNHSIPYTCPGFSSIRANTSSHPEPTSSKQHPYLNTSLKPLTKNAQRKLIIW